MKGRMREVEEEEEEEEEKSGKEVVDWMRTGAEFEEEELEEESRDRLETRPTASAAAASAAAACANPRETLSASSISKGANLSVRATPWSCCFFF